MLKTTKITTKRQREAIRAFAKRAGYELVARRRRLGRALGKAWACCDFPQASLTNSANFFRA
jgi:hypothetical protein